MRSVDSSAWDFSSLTLSGAADFAALHNAKVDMGLEDLVGAAMGKKSNTALNIAGHGVREVINEVQVDDESGLTDRGRDLWIAARLRGQLLVDDQVSSINYSVEVVNRVVYVIGVARTDAELARVLGHARAQSYVKSVVNYVRVGA